MTTDSKTWSEFIKIKNGVEVKFRIQEIGKEKFEEVFDMFMNHYATEEPLHKAAGIAANADALREWKQIKLDLAFKEHHQIDVCYLDDGSEELKLIGGSVMVHMKTAVPPPDQIKAETNELKVFFNLISCIKTAYDVGKCQNVDSFFAGRGVVVDPEYSGLGIAGEILKARIEACKAYNVPMTSAWMTAFGTQKAAAKLGWETVCELNYEELERETGVTFKGGPDSCKLMIGKVPR